jgi:DnaJ-class molecular chaperone
MPRPFPKTRTPNGLKVTGPWPHGKPIKRCPQCDGTGAPPGALNAAATRDQFGASVPTCQTCDGRGKVIDWSKVGPGGVVSKT